MIETANPGSLFAGAGAPDRYGSATTTAGSFACGFRLHATLILLLLVGMSLTLAAPPSFAKGRVSSDQTQQTRPLRLVVFGDSLTAGYMLPQSASFPTVLERELKKSGRNVQIVNASVSGDTASGGLARIDWALGGGADAVIVELGANDMLRGVDPARTKEALDGIIRRIKSSGAVVLLAGMQAAPGMGRAFEQQFNGIYPALAKAHDVMFYPFFLDGIAGRKELNLEDGIHPNSAGVEVLVQNILPYVLRLLESTPHR